MKKIVLILSGGMDSVTLLYHLRAEGYEVHSLSFDYGQRHTKELDCAKSICHELHVPWHLVDLGSVGALLHGSALLGDTEIPLGSYAEPNMRLTVVPNRNAIMLSIAMAYACIIHASEVAFAAHTGDHAIYPDCQPEFVDRMSAVAQISDYHPVQIVAPFIQMTKGEIALRGKALHVPFDQTWTCYQGEQKHCGQCATCLERKEAMTFADVKEADDFYETRPKSGF